MVSLDVPPLRPTRSLPPCLGLPTWAPAADVPGAGVPDPQAASIPPLPSSRPPTAPACSRFLREIAAVVPSSCVMACGPSLGLHRTDGVAAEHSTAQLLQAHASPQSMPRCG